MELWLPDVVVGKSGIWVDSRAYGSLVDAIGAVGEAKKTIYISKVEEVDTDLTIESNISLCFIKEGAINQLSGTTTFKTKNIAALNSPIFTGNGHFSFAAGTVLKTSWFESLNKAFAETVNSAVVLEVDEADSLTADATCGEYVVLKFTSQGTIVALEGYDLTINGKLDAGRFQIFDQTGGGEVKLASGAVDEIYPEWWGAVGDGSTDDTQALQAAIDCAKYITYQYSSSPLFAKVRLSAPVVLRPSAIYLCTNTLFTGGTSTNCLKELIGTGAVIYSKAANKPIIDHTGAYFTRFHEVVLEGDSTSTPSVGVLLARYANAVSAGHHDFTNCEIRGYFTVAAVYNYASEGNNFDRCRFLIYGGQSCMILTAENNRSITSAFTTTPTGYQSSLNQNILNCTLWNFESTTGGSNASCIEIDTWARVRIDGCTLHTEVDDKPMVWLRCTSSVNRNRDITITNNLFHSDYETGIYIDSAPNINNLIIDGNDWGKATNTTQVSCSASQNIWDCFIRAPNIDFSASSASVRGNSILIVRDRTFDSYAGTSVKINYIFNGTIYALNGTNIVFSTLGQVKGKVIRGDTGSEQRFGPYQSANNTVTSGTGEQGLKSFTIPANTLSLYNSVRVIGSFTKSGSGGNKTIKFYIGTTSYTIHPAANNTYSVYFEAILMPVSTSALRGHLLCWSGTSLVYNSHIASVSADLTADVTMKWTGECANAGDTITQLFGFASY